MQTFKGFAAIVTGAANGIGRGLALKAAKEGMDVAICDIAAGPLAETDAMLKKAGAKTVSSTLDVTDPAAVEAFAKTVSAQLAPPALVFANAGILAQGKVLSHSPSEWRRLFDVNVMGIVNTLRAFMPALKAQKTQSHIVITGSQASFWVYESLGAYSTTKHALWALADGLRLDLETEKAPIAVSVLAPGMIDTAIYAATEQPAGVTRVAGMSPAELADITFAGIRNNDRIISSHATLIDAAGGRLDAAMAEIKKGPRPH